MGDAIRMTDAELREAVGVMVAELRMAGVPDRTGLRTRVLAELELREAEHAELKQKKSDMHRRAQQAESRVAKAKRRLRAVAALAQAPLGAVPPASFWRSVPCGHPPDPVAFENETGWVCHCASLLDPSLAISDGAAEGAPGPIVPCDNCGCFVALPEN